MKRNNFKQFQIKEEDEMSSQKSDFENHAKYLDIDEMIEHKKVKKTVFANNSDSFLHKIQKSIEIAKDISEYNEKSDFKNY